MARIIVLNQRQMCAAPECFAPLERYDFAREYIFSDGRPSLYFCAPMPRGVIPGKTHMRFSHKKAYVDASQYPNLLHNPGIATHPLVRKYWDSLESVVCDVNQWEEMRATLSQVDEMVPVLGISQNCPICRRGWSKLPNDLERLAHLVVCQGRSG